jgi:hypothetical protein
VETIGNLDEQHARAYFIDHLLPQSSLESERQGTFIKRWDEVYEVTGGNMGELRKFPRLARVRNFDHGELLFFAQ